MATYAVIFTGLTKRPTYDSLLGDIANQPMIRYPDRRATQLRNSPFLAQLDGVNLAEIANQQARMQNEQLKQAIISGISQGQIQTGTGTQMTQPSTQALVGGVSQTPASFYGAPADVPTAPFTPGGTIA